MVSYFKNFESNFVIYVEVGSIVVPGCGAISGCDTRLMHPCCFKVLAGNVEHYSYVIVSLPIAWNSKQSTSRKHHSTGILDVEYINNWRYSLLSVHIYS